MPIPTLNELTIAQVHDGFRSGDFTVRELVQAYLDRIESVDRAGAALNSIVTVAASALDDADALDQAYARTGELVGPLHGVPVVLKDQIETAGTATSFGSAAAADYVPAADATAVRRLRAAGAVVLAKTSMPDFATSWFSTSSRTGLTKNPYDLARDPGGSSSGTAAAVAANLALVGIGEDTGGSIRLPASFCNLVGLRVTPGLISRAGMSSLVVPQDTPGPMTRTVTDAARLLDVLVGYDPQDLYSTEATVAPHVGSYTDGLVNATVAGRRLGVLRQVFGSADDRDGVAVNTVVDKALAGLAAAGAELVDVEIADLDHYVGFTSVYYTRSLQDMNAFLATRPEIGIDSIVGLHARRQYHEKLDLLEGIATGPSTPQDDPDYLARVLAQQEFQRLVLAVMADHDVDGLVFPDVRQPAPTHQDILSDRWTCLTYPTNTVIASQLLMPAITVPVGFTDDGLPVGLEIMARPHAEVQLLQVARGVERAVPGRRAPSLDTS